MSIKVTLPAAFTRHTDGRKHFDSAAGNLPGLLADMDAHYFGSVGLAAAA